MAILFHCTHESVETYRAPLAALLPSMPLRDSADMGPVDAIRYALVWHPPAGLLASLPNLRAVFNLGAGVDGVLGTPAIKELPAHVPLIRLADAGMAPQMVEWVLHGVLRFHRRFEDYAAEQAAGRWSRLAVKPAAETRVGILGLGVLGQAVARQVRALGYQTRGWSRRPRSLDGMATFAGAEGLTPFLAETDILVCLLPLTPETRGLLNAGTLGRLPRGAALINAARGAHVVDADLLRLLDAGHLQGAQLDVFDQEPLPASHPYWTHPRVRITPHVAAETLPGPACDQIADAIGRLERGDTPPHVVDRQAGY